MKKAFNVSQLTVGQVAYLKVERVSAFPVHPHAATYPMMSEDKLDAMAADIRSARDGRRTGQIHSVVIRKFGDTYQLIDGRNRLEACRRAGVPVRVILKELTDDEAIEQIISLNDQRRQLTVRQQAEAGWEYYAEQKKIPGRKITQADVAKQFGISPRSFAKWKPGGQEAVSADAKKGNNNNRYPIDQLYRRDAFCLSELLIKPVLKHIDPKEPRKLLNEIKRLYKTEFPNGSR